MLHQSRQIGQPHWVYGTSISIDQSDGCNLDNVKWRIGLAIMSLTMALAIMILTSPTICTLPFSTSIG